MMTKFLVWLCMWCWLAAPAVAADTFNAPSIGVHCTEIASIYDGLKKDGIKLPTRLGVLVNHVEPNSPADLANIKDNDIILRIQRGVIQTKEDLVAAVAKLKVGEKCVLTSYAHSEPRGQLRWKRKTVQLTPVTRRDVCLNAMSQKKDDVMAITTWRHLESPTVVNKKSELFCYIIKPDAGKPILILQLQYIAKDWLFIRHLIIKADNETFMLSTQNMKQDYSLGRTWEWHRWSVQATELAMLQAVMNAKSVTLRYDGSTYCKDRQLSIGEIRRIRVVMSAHQILSQLANEH